MQEFTYEAMGDGSYGVVGYQGDEAEVVVPAEYRSQRVTVLYDDLFAGHTEIESVRIPNTVTDLGECLFDGCEGLRRIELPSQLRSLWGATFCRCGITTIVLPDKLRSIPPFAFKDCKHLRWVVCGRGMRKIRAWAFEGCDRLQKVIYGPDVDVSPDAFESHLVGNSRFNRSMHIEPQGK